MEDGVEAAIVNFPLVSEFWIRAMAGKHNQSRYKSLEGYQANRLNKLFSNVCARGDSKTCPH